MDKCKFYPDPNYPDPNYRKFYPDPNYRPQLPRYYPRPQLPAFTLTAIKEYIEVTVKRCWQLLTIHLLLVFINNAFIFP